jgi:carboxyl-terminal processing protease
MIRSISRLLPVAALGSCAASLRAGLVAAAPALRIFILAAALLFAAAPAFAQPISDQEKKDILKRAEAVIKSRAYASTADFDKFPEMLAKYKEQIDRADTVPSFTRVLNRLMNEYGISHFDLMTPAMAENRRQDKKVGIGIKHSGRGEPFTDGLLIDQIIEGGPAERAGIKDGDRITEVDGAALESAEQLKGAEDSKITLTIRRAEGGKVEKIEVTRGYFRTRDPESFVRLADDAVLIKIPSFDSSYDRRRVESFFKQAAEAKFLIIDLRFNGGGATTNLQHFLGMILPKGTEFGTSVDRETADKYKEETGKDPADVVAVATWSRDKWKIRRNAVEPFHGKIAVLINAASASASEITAAALKELHTPPALLAGSRTAGAVLVANDVSLPDGFRMMVPISEYVTIKGRRLEGNPLEPDLRISVREALSQPRKPDADELVKKALAELRSN